MFDGIDTSMEPVSSITNKFIFEFLSQFHFPGLKSLLPNGALFLSSALCRLPRSQPPCLLHSDFLLISRRCPFTCQMVEFASKSCDLSSGDLSLTVGDMKKRSCRINEKDFLSVTHGIDNKIIQQDVPVDDLEALDISVNQENAPGAISGRSRKKQKVTSNEEKHSEIMEIKSVMEELVAAIRDGNDVIRERTRKLPQMSGEEVWNMIKECGFSSTNVIKMYRLLMSDVDHLKMFVECPMEVQQDLLMEIMKDFEPT